MLVVKFVGLIVLSLLFWDCSQPRQGLKTPGASPDKGVMKLPFNRKDFIVGTWAGHSTDGGKLSMYVVFNGDNTVVIDYTPTGGRRLETRYDFEDQNTIRISSYPEKLVIEEEGADEIRFRPANKRIREDIDIIYVCNFTRVKK